MGDMKKKVNITSCFRINLIILTSIGLWVPKRYWGTFVGYLCNIYSFMFVAFILVIPLISEIINEIVLFGDLEKMVQAAYLMLSRMVIFVKCYKTLLTRTRIQKLIDTLDDPTFNVMYAESCHRVTSPMRSHVMIVMVYLVCALFTVLLWSVFPLLDMSGETRLPLLMWYPFDECQSPWFELIYLYQAVGTSYLAACNVGFDTLASGMMAMACGQLDLLCDKLTDERQQYYSCADPTYSNIKTREHLIDCINHHKKISCFVDEIQELLSASAFSQMGGTTVIVCVTAFRLTTVRMSVEFFSMVMYMVSLLLQIFVYCYFGNELHETSLRVNNAAYGSPWYTFSPGNRRLLILMMERCKRPLTVAASIFTLSLPTFMGILRLSYSYFAVLRSANNR